MADPEQYRSREEVERWQARDPIPAFGNKLVAEGVLGEPELAQLDAQALARVDEAVAFAESSPFPKPESLYDDVYVLDQDVPGWYSVHTTDQDHIPSQDKEVSQAGEIPRQMSDAVRLGEEAS